MEVWRKNLYTIWFIQFIAIGGISLILPFLPFFIRELGVTSPEQERIWSGWAYAGPFLLSFISTPIWGALGDRYGRKLMSVRALFGLGISQILVGLSQTPLQLVIFRMIQGVVSGFIPAALALVAANTPREKSGYALGVLQTSTASGSIIGPFIGGALSDLVGYRVIFFFNAGLCVILGFYLIYSFKEISTVSENDEKISIFDNFKFIFNQKHLIASVVIILLAQSAIMTNQPIFALFIESMVKDRTYLATITGLVFGIIGIANVISAPWWGKRNDRTGPNKNLYYALLGAGIAVFLHSFMNSPYQIAIVRFFLGFCIGGILPALYTIMSNETPVSRRGGVLGISSSFTILGNMIGPILGGYIASFTNFQFVFWFGASLLIICSFYAKKFLK
jgi:MFS transporter, DHA1 family, multidrug resistance protein